MRVAIFGGPGFVGSYITDELIAAGHQPVLLTRPDSLERHPAPSACETLTGDIADEAAVRATLEGADAAIYNIGILREYPKRGITFEALHHAGARRAMDLAAETGAKRFLLMSANGVKADGTAYQQTKYLAEEYLRSGSLQWTIFQPSVIFGDPRGRMEFATQLYRDIVSAPLPLPLFYDGLLPTRAGETRMSPVHVRDVARLFALSLTREDSIGQTYRVGGPEAIRWKDILQIIAAATGKKRFGLPTPAWAMKTVADLLSGLDILPVTRDQLTMLMEGNTCDASEVFRAYGIDPTPFDAAHLSYLLEAPAPRSSATAAGG